MSIVMILLYMAQKLRVGCQYPVHSLSAPYVIEQHKLNSLRYWSAYTKVNINSG